MTTIKEKGSKQIYQTKRKVAYTLLTTRNKRIFGTYMSCLKQVIEVMDILDDPRVDGEKVAEKLGESGAQKIQINHLRDDKGETDSIKILIEGTNGKSRGGEAPTLGIIGRLGGVGVRPKRIGMVSDADGAIVAIATALKLSEMRMRGDTLIGDVIITTHITPRAPIIPHDPVPFVDSPVHMKLIQRYEVDPDMDAILSIDATKGNRVIKVDGFAITPTVKNGWILKVSDDLIDIYERVTGDVVKVVPITMQDITPMDNNIYHINSIMLPWLATEAPVVGVATTARIPIPGSGTGANYIYGLEAATRFCVEVAKEYTSGRCRFYDEDEYRLLTKLYGDMRLYLGKYIK